MLVVGCLITVRQKAYLWNLWPQYGLQVFQKEKKFYLFNDEGITWKLD